MEHTGDLIADLIIPDEELQVTRTETTYKMNFALFKIKRNQKKQVIMRHMIGKNYHQTIIICVSSDVLMKKGH